MKRISIVLTILILGIAGSLHSQEVFTYTGIDGNTHNIEVFSPERDAFPGKRPAAIFFHGGGWRGGNLAQFRGLSEYLASRGMVAMTANYSTTSKEAEKNLKPGESRKTVCVIDGKSVIRWIKENADDLGIDPERIVAGGGSAGGHISVLAMMDTEHNNPKDPEGIDTKVQAFLLFSPAYTFLEKDNTPEVNVFNHVDKTFPPSLFLVGEIDKGEEKQNKLASELTKRGNDVEYWMARGEGHMFFRKGEWVDVTTKKVDEYLVKHGFLEKFSDCTGYSSDKKLELIEL